MELKHAHYAVVTNNFGVYGLFAPLVDEVHHVVFVDGIYLSYKLVILIACSKTHVLGWYVAKKGKPLLLGRHSFHVSQPLTWWCVTAGKVSPVQ